MIISGLEIGVNIYSKYLLRGGTMNKDKELEEAIKRLDKLIELRKNKCGEIKFDSCICETRDLETVLQALNNFIFVIEEMTQALENSQEECGQYREFIAVTGRKDVDDITATKYVRIQREGYLRGRKEEQEKAKQFIEENSIPKKKIEDKKNT